jgi:hypothetical protein
MTITDLLDDLECQLMNLPKIDLSVDINTSMRKSTFIQLAKNKGLRIESYIGKEINVETI